ncbi:MULTISPECIES: GNAT family N-acetyltransferase [Paenibacillus]|uniref:Putative acetyltransferase n=1 Tax=Paenibacillus illinoisensis TaxID=59845 RepID=A0A2W0CD21_9BACL|nr:MULTISPECIES: GNAT family N-acetyltransferase [Paenibacillus]PAD31735.1 GNAT family N-acetyltransferase [Paenibacillus sp. 7523-1]PYY28589.1 putative acetyltransferase [Paenibacillus illinoisensis]
MRISYRSNLDGIGVEQLSEHFFDGWPNPPSKATFLRLLEQSYATELAVDDETGKVIGFIQAISDGVLSAYIPLLEVVPEFQGKGIGTTLTERMLKRLQGLYMIDLLCDTETQPFYQKQGMRRASGMMVRHYSNQNGSTYL